MKKLIIFSFVAFSSLFLEGSTNYPRINVTVKNNSKNPVIASFENDTVQIIQPTQSYTFNNLVNSRQKKSVQRPSFIFLDTITHDLITGSHGYEKQQNPTMTITNDNADKLVVKF